MGTCSLLNQQKCKKWVPIFCQANKNSMPLYPQKLFKTMNVVLKTTTYRLLSVLTCYLFVPCITWAQVPAGTPLLSSKANTLKYYSDGKPSATIKQVTVKNQLFSKALQVNSFGGTGSSGLYGNLTTPLRKGDVLWISFSTRSLQSKRETGESFIELRVDQLVNGKYVWPPHLERGISFGEKWTKTSIPFILTKDVKPEDVRVVIRFDSYPQSFEISPITFINCGQNVSLNDLPKTVVKYDGSAPDASWRKEAEKRIEKYRKGDLQIRIVDNAGNPVKGAEVTANLNRIAYNWGTAVTSERILDTVNVDMKMYRDTLARYFNQVVFENEMKWKNWVNQDEETKGLSTLRALRWLRTKNLTARGHVMVWPSWQNSPLYLRKFKHDKEALRSAIIESIKEQTNIMYGQFAEWDVINEATLHHDFMDILGRKEMKTWFETAHTSAPRVKLFLNDYTMFHNEKASDSFYENAKFLVDSKAPIDGIGEQAHIGGTPPGIPFVLERLDKFAQLGLPIIITEFDINSDDDDFKANYLRDFITAIFSHPATTGLLQWGFWEGAHWFPSAALWNKDWSIRPNGKVYTDLITNKWHTCFNGTTSDTGDCLVRGFCGKYDITVRYEGKTYTRQTILENRGNTIIIQIKNDESNL